MKKIGLIFLVALCLAGCATSVRYTSYTDQQSVPKPKDYFISIYPGTVKIPVGQSYRVIGKVEVQGYANDGVTPLGLEEKAKNIARSKGADAIINAVSNERDFGGTYAVREYYGYHHFPRTRYIPYEDTMLRFTGELIIFSK